MDSSTPAPTQTSEAAIAVLSSTETREAVKTAEPELPPLSAPVSELLGRGAPTETARSLTADVKAGDALDDIVSRAVRGARREGSGRVAAWALGAVLIALFALRVIFDDVLPKLLLLGLVGAVAALVVALIAHAVIEGRRQRAMLEALEHLTRLAQHDAAMRDRVAPQIESIVTSLSAPSPLIPLSPRKRA